MFTSQVHSPLNLTLNKFDLLLFDMVFEQINCIRVWQSSDLFVADILQSSLEFLVDPLVEEIYIC